MNWLPKAEAGLYLTHNDHKNVCRAVTEFYQQDDFISDDEYHKAVQEDSVWCLQWYPETPIGFNIVCASSLEAIREYIEKEVK